MQLANEMVASVRRRVTSALRGRQVRKDDPEYGIRRRLLRNREDLTDESLSWASLMPIETHQRQLQALEEILQTGRCQPFETEILRPDGERVPVLVGAARLSPRRRDGVAFVLDIS